MLLSVTVPQGRGMVQLDLDYNRKKWTAQPGNGWADIASSEGTFELPKEVPGVMWIKDSSRTTRDQTVVIVYNPPTGEGDSGHGTGLGRIYQPKVGALQDGTINWTATMSPVRKRILEICRNNLPAVGQPAKEPPNCIASEAGHGYTNCGAFPGYIARQLGYYVPWDQGARLHAQYMKKGEKGEALWEATRDKLKIEAQDYKYVVPEAEGKISVEGKPAGFTNSLAAGWGHGKLEEYPIKLEQVRKLPAGSIWISPKKDSRPQPGDFYVLERHLPIDGNPIGFAHVGVVIDTTNDRWTTADGGQGGGFAVGHKTRKYSPDDNILMLDPPLKTELDDGWRRLEGWVNVDQLFAGWKP
jgi:hypothetical protein